MNQNGFIPIIFIIIGAVVIASATFGVVKYKDEITASVVKIFKRPKVETPDIDSTGKDESVEEAELIEEPIIEEPEKNDVQQLEGRLKKAEQKRLEAERKLAEEKARQEEQKQQEEFKRQTELEKQRQQELEKVQEEISEMEGLIKKLFYRDGHECQSKMKNTETTQEALSSGDSELVNLANQTIENICRKIDQARKYLLSELRKLERIDNVDTLKQELEKFLREIEEQDTIVDQTIEYEVRKEATALARLIKEQEEENRRLKEEQRKLEEQLIREAKEFDKQLAELDRQIEEVYQKIEDVRNQGGVSMITLMGRINKIKNEELYPLLTQRDMLLGNPISVYNPYQSTYLQMTPDGMGGYFIYDSSGSTYLRMSSDGMGGYTIYGY